jgi:NAD(P)-dependent dehydrogenase (short-subunit alcohol dehydrogenase family)
MSTGQPMPEPRILAGRVAVVTGAATGIGRSIAHALARQRAKVAVLDIDEEGAGVVAAAIEAKGGEAAALRCDVTQPIDCSDAVAAVTERWGGVDLLVNNAGISHHSRGADTDPSVIRRVMDVNFFGAVHCTHAALPSLIERRGAVVAISSVAGFAPLVGRAGYAASKHALHGYFDTLRVELAERGVDVLLVCPAYADTNIDRHAVGAAKQPVRKRTVGRLLHPDEVADAVVRGVEERQRAIALSWVAKSSYWLWTLAPAVYERIMRSQS